MKFAKISLSTNEILSIEEFEKQPPMTDESYFIATESSSYKGNAVVGGRFDPYSAIFIGASPEIIGIDPNLTSPETIRPKLIVTSISSTSQIDVIDNKDVRCQSGTTVDFICHLIQNTIIIDENTTIPMTGTFLTPIYKMAAGQIIGQRLIKTVMTNGVVNISVTLPENGEWHVTENGINSNLDPSQHMIFEGVKMMVYD